MKKPELKLRRIVFGLSLLTVLSVTIGGCLYYSTWRASALDNAHREASEHLEAIADHIQLSVVVSEIGRSFGWVKGIAATTGERR